MNNFDLMFYLFSFLDEKTSIDVSKTNHLSYFTYQKFKHVQISNFHKKYQKILCFEMKHQEERLKEIKKKCAKYSYLSKIYYVGIDCSIYKNFLKNGKLSILKYLWNTKLHEQVKENFHLIQYNHAYYDEIFHSFSENERFIILKKSIEVGNRFIINKYSNFIKDIDKGLYDSEETMWLLCNKLNATCILQIAQYFQPVQQLSVKFLLESFFITFKITTLQLMLDHTHCSVFHTVLAIYHLYYNYSRTRVYCRKFHTNKEILMDLCFQNIMKQLDQNQILLSQIMLNDLNSCPIELHNIFSTIFKSYQKVCLTSIMFQCSTKEIYNSWKKLFQFRNTILSITSTYKQATLTTAIKSNDIRKFHFALHYLNIIDLQDFNILFSFSDIIIKKILSMRIVVDCSNYILAINSLDILLFFIGIYGEYFMLKHLFTTQDVKVAWKISKLALKYKDSSFLIRNLKLGLNKQNININHLHKIYEKFIYKIGKTTILHEI
jgi:hypothetical protein